MKFHFKFKGRQVGAIGKVHKISVTFTAPSLGEAMWRLYRNYECIFYQDIQATYEQDIPIDVLKSTELVKPQSFYTAEDMRTTK